MNEVRLKKLASSLIKAGPSPALRPPLTGNQLISQEITFEAPPHLLGARVPFTH